MKNFIYSGYNINYKGLIVSKFSDLTKLAIALGIFILFLMPTAYSASDANDGSDDEPIPEEPFEDDFEFYEDFTLDFPPWTQYDGNLSPTYGIKDHKYPNQYFNGSYIIFNPQKVSPPLSEDWNAHSGDKYAACFSATNPPNNDWLITPQLNINGNMLYIGIQCVSDAAFAFLVDDFNVTNIFKDGFDFSFWAKSASAEYGLEKFRVGVSLADNDPSNFTIISPEPYVETPEDWTKFAYTYEFSKIDIKIKGGFGVTATIMNNDEENVTDLEVNILIENGFILVGRQSNYTVDIPAERSIDIRVFIFGFGNPTIYVSAGRAEAVLTGKVVLFFLVDLQ